MTHDLGRTFTGALLESLTLSRVLVCGSAAWVTYRVLRGLYNISPLHPLSKVPGPRLAAATYLPEFWYDVVKGGRYTHRILEMHQQYGPIVRINPDETHCSDAAFIDEIFALGGRKRDKSQHQVNATGGWAENVFSTRDHDLHRLRRAPVAKFFSRNMISRLEGEIQVLVGRLCDKLLARRGCDEPFDVAMAYSCFTSDAISDYCFAEPFGLLAQDGWTPNFRQATLAVLKPVFYFRFFPVLNHFIKVSKWFLDYLPEDTALFVRTLQIDIPERVAKTKADVDAGVLFSQERPTVFVDLMQSDLPASEKTLDRLHSEAVSVMGAATETTSWAMGVTTYYLLSQPEVMGRLRAELELAVEDVHRLPPWTTLEKLPYLSAVIHEGLRLSYGVSSRTARIPSQEDLVYRGEFNKKPVELVLPQGYPVGMSSVIVHHDESIFPDSHSFVPERWLDGQGNPRKDLDRALLSFSKGSRACLGKNLALCEMYLAMSALALRVFPHMRLYDTSDRDVRYDHDTLNPHPARGSRGIRVIVQS